MWASPLKTILSTASLLAACGVFTAGAATPISAADLRLIQRVTFGPTAETLQTFSREGRHKWLESQLHYVGDQCLPAGIRNRIEKLDIEHDNPAAVWRARQAALKEAREQGSQQARMAVRREYDRQSLAQAFERRTLRALYCSNQLQEKLVWFWYNHFNIYGHKGITPIFVPDYEEQAIRPHVLGRFQDLLMATLTHPAMLEYLDNARNIKGKPNENYGREIMELHTMGVDSGYTQHDVQELAAILSGARFYVKDKPPRQARRLSAYYVEHGAFIFDPTRHDAGDKIFLGKPFKGSPGFDEIERAVATLARQPATARFISRKLATYFLSDDPPKAVVDQMAQTYMKTDGEIASVLRTLFESKLFDANVKPKFKDPVQYIYSSIRLLYGDRVVLNTAPIQRWIKGLAEAPYGHLTPEGYGMTRGDWANADQLTKRLGYAGQLASPRNKLFASAHSGLAPRENNIALNPASAAYGESISGKSTRSYLDNANLQALKPIYESPNLSPLLNKTHRTAQKAALIISSPAFMEY